jgi:hypothetical protein
VCEFLNSSIFLTVGKSGGMLKKYREIKALCSGFTQYVPSFCSTISQPKVGIEIELMVTSGFFLFKSKHRYLVFKVSDVPF